MRSSVSTRDYASLMVVDKAFGARQKTAVYESRRMKELHQAFLTMEHSKYLFSENTAIRATKMDIDKVTPESLCNIYLKTGKECGIVMLPSQCRINFQYAILPNGILLNVFKGSYHDAERAKTESEFDARFSNVYVGEVVITDSEVKISPFSVINILNDAVITGQNDRLKMAMKDTLYGKQINWALKEMEYFRSGDTIEVITEKLDPKTHPFLYNENRRVGAAKYDLLIALHCFIFLKCAKVIDKTFIADNNTQRCTYRRLRKEANVDYIYVDGHYDESIKVINPFQVSGHFRNQPKKNEKGEWYKELIYIDSFMKHGYTRRSTKEKLEQL